MGAGRGASFGTFRVSNFKRSIVKAFIVPFEVNDKR